MNIATLQNEYNDLRQKIKATESPCHFLTERRDNGSPHVEIENDKYHLVTTERGLELERLTTKDKDLFLYWLISLSIFGMACAFELRNRIEDQDSRRIIFAKKIELMKRVDANWAEKLQKEIDEILVNHPFNDRK